MKLGERLAALAAMVEPGARVADIGTDHAYLPIELVQSGVAVWAAAGDVHAGPYEAAKANVAGLHLENKISVRLGDGLAVVTPGEVDTVLIAGMGGSTIIEILTANPAVVAGLNKLVLQPMIGAAAVRRWLASNGWQICQESLAWDEGRLYEIIGAKPGVAEAAEPILDEIGPVLWQEKPVLLKRHMEQLIKQTKRVLQEMDNSPAAKSSEKYQGFLEKLRQLEVKQQCL